jgi:threonine aldolase
LEHHVQRLAEDHANAQYLADGLGAAGLTVTPPQTNVVYLQVAPSQIEGLRVHLRQRGIIASVAPRTRLMTHMDLPRGKIDCAIQAFRDYPHWPA